MRVANTGRQEIESADKWGGGMLPVGIVSQRVG